MFHVKIERDEDGIYCSSVPALPGCLSDGETEAEALQNIRGAIDGYLWAEDHKAIQSLSEAERESMIDLKLAPYASPHLAAEAA